MKAFVDPETCIGCAACEDICPDVFKMTDDDLAVVQVDPVPAADMFGPARGTRPPRWRG